MKRDTDISFERREDRYELLAGGKVAAFANYQSAPGHVTFVHTEVLPGNEGRGLGSQLARHVLDDSRKQGLKVSARCSFIAKFIEEHPEYQDLLVGQNRR